MSFFLWFKLSKRDSVYITIIFTWY